MVDVNPLAMNGDEDTRRSFLKRGAFATVGSDFAASTAAAQGGTDEAGGGDVVADETFEAVTHAGQIRPLGQFYITSPGLDFTPAVPERFGGPMTGYDMRIATYMNTAERFHLYVANDAEFPPYRDANGYVVDDEGEYGPEEWHPPEMYTFTGEFRQFGESDQLVRVEFAPLAEDVEASLWDSGNVDGQDDFDDERF
jgi:hypothetical protein